MARRSLHPRKLLVASTGVLTVSYLGACDTPSKGYSVANLVAPSATTPVVPTPSPDPMLTTVVANLIAPPIFPPTVGNALPTPAPTIAPAPTAVPTAIPSTGAVDAAAPLSDAAAPLPDAAAPLSDGGPLDLDASLDGSAEDAGSDVDDASVANDETDGGQ